METLGVILIAILGLVILGIIIEVAFALLGILLILGVVALVVTCIGGAIF